MILYLVFNYSDHVTGVFDTKKDAQAFVQHFDQWRIEQHTLNEQTKRVQQNMYFYVVSLTETGEFRWIKKTNNLLPYTEQDATFWHADYYTSEEEALSAAKALFNANTCAKNVCTPR
jgi:Uri superfamily endonuclease